MQTKKKEKNILATMEKKLTFYRARASYFALISLTLNILRFIQTPENKTLLQNSIIYEVLTNKKCELKEQKMSFSQEQYVQSEHELHIKVLVRHHVQTQGRMSHTQKVRPSFHSYVIELVATTFLLDILYILS